MGIAAVLLGWRPAEYWSSTPCEFWAAIEAWEEQHPSADDD